MTRLFRWSLTAYRRLPIFFPDDLRRDFGSEMLEAFAHDLSVECDARGINGAIRVWRITLRELIRIGFPAWLRIPAVAVPGLSAATVLLSQSPLLIMTVRREAQMSFRAGDATPFDALFALALSAIVTALTSFVAVCRWKRASLISLGIDRPGIG